MNPLREARANPRQLFHEPARDNRAALACLLDALREGHRETGSLDGLYVGLQLTHSGRFAQPRGKPAPKIAAHHPGKSWSLTVNDKPDMEGAREVLVDTINAGQAWRLRNLEWIEKNRSRVAEATDGRVGYVHIQGMGQPQVEIFERDLYAAASGKEALEAFRRGDDLPPAIRNSVGEDGRLLLHADLQHDTRSSRKRAGSPASASKPFTPVFPMCDAVKVTIFDSQQLTMGLGLQALTAAEAAEAGCSVSEIVDLH